MFAGSSFFSKGKMGEVCFALFMRYVINHARIVMCVHTCQLQSRHQLLDPFPILSSCIMAGFCNRFIESFICDMILMVKYSFFIL